jgi:hypothetical protein
LPPGQPGSVDDPTLPNAPSDNPYIVQVGGTTLTTTGPGGARVSETVWNWGIEFGIDGIGSSGGISGFYALPAWQQGISMVGNHGSTTFRNVPDVALTGDNVYVIADNGINYDVAGTSCAAPLWAGFTALANQQAVLSSRPPVGFINPAMYALAKTVTYTNLFNDITNGNNIWSLSPTNFPAVSGFDLCTGLGTPNGTNLINALVGGAVPTGPVISAPLGPWGTNLAVMNGSNPNGDWFLFVQDDKPKDSGVISSGWYVTLTSANPVGYAADNAIYAMPTNQISTIAVNTHWNLSLAVTNYGPSSSTNVFVSDTLPMTIPGITLVGSPDVTAGSVAIVGTALTWTIGNLATNAGASMNLSFYATATGTFTNIAIVNSDTTDPNPDDDSVTSLLAVITPSPPILVPTLLPHGAGFQLSVTGDGLNTTIQGSTNLITGPWVNLFSGIPPFTFTDTTATNYPSRFYRAIIGP